MTRTKCRDRFEGQKNTGPILLLPGKRGKIGGAGARRKSVYVTGRRTAAANSRLRCPIGRAADDAPNSRQDSRPDKAPHKPDMRRSPAVSHRPDMPNLRS